MWFVVIEVATMAPRAVDGRRWYRERFGKRAVGKRRAVVPAVL
jgi:3-oxo-5-alpha-steroid 4-dehydrogenase 1